MGSISVITPTAGVRRAGLKRVVDLLAEFLQPGDEHLVIWDTDVMPADPPTSPYTRHMHYQNTASIVGNAQRDFAMAIARGDWMMFCDDDDLPTKVAIDHIHTLEPTKYDAHVYTMNYPSSLYTLVADPLNVQYAKIGGPQIVLPNDPNSGLRWMATNVYASDFELIRAASQRYTLKFHPEIVICLVRPFEDYIGQIRKAQEAAHENLGSA